MYRWMRRSERYPFLLGARDDAQELRAFVLARAVGAEVVGVASASSVDELLARLGAGVVEEAWHVSFAWSCVGRVGAFFRRRHCGRTLRQC